ncbi:LysR substrate binding domain [Cedecea neteri]|nr:LysR substrate binding domain [Cedecea neteri]
MLDTDKYPDVICQHWQEKGGQPNVTFTTTSFETVRSLVAKGRGVTILSDLVYRPWSLEGLRVMRKTIEDSATYMDVGAVAVKGKMLAESERMVLDYLRGIIIRLDDNA